MKIFEYHTEELSAKGVFGTFKKEIVDEKLEIYGSQGWELVNIIQSMRDGYANKVLLVFKREKQTT